MNSVIHLTPYSEEVELPSARKQTWAAVQSTMAVRGEKGRVMAVYQVSNIAHDSSERSAKDANGSGARVNPLAGAIAELHLLCLVKTLSGREINSLHNFLNPLICYDCSLCSAFSAPGYGRSSGFFDPGKTCSWRISHFVSS
jgi:hypothetical protein